MRTLRTLLALVALSVALASCGSSGKDDSQSSATATTATVATTTTPSKAPPAPVLAKADRDHDNDVGTIEADKNNDSVVDYGHAASPSEQRAITALVKRYYAAAVAENGAAACSMLYSTLEEAVPEDYGQSPPSQPYMRGKTCPAVVTLLFKHFHPQLALEAPKLRVARVRLVEHHGLAILHFGALPERQISVAREGHIWRIQMLLDSEIS